MTTGRNTLLDWLRALAILMVVTVHTWSLSHIDSTAYPVLALCYKLFYQCGVPLFVMISGALQLPSSILPIGVFYKKRFTRILVPFLIWSIVIYTLSCIVGKYEDIHSWQDAIRNYIPFLLTNRINEAYWFMGLIIALYAITPFLQRAFQTCSKQTLIGIIVCWLIYIVAQRFYPELYLLQYSSRLTYFLGFYILGFLLRREWGGFGQLKESKLLRAVSDCSFLTYLIHMLFITPIYTVLGFTANAPLWQCIVLPISVSVLVVALCTILGVVVKKYIPFYRYLGIN